ncbi:hypothetical protein CF319_g9612, partial [Tilletia indica]
MSLDVSISLVGLVFDGVLVVPIEGKMRKMHISLMEYEDNSEDEDEDDEDDDEGEDQVQDVDAARSRTESNMPPPLARSFTANNAISRSSPDSTNANVPTDKMVSPIPPPKPRPLLPA